MRNDYTDYNNLGRDSMNVVVMVGRLTRDPELRFIAGSGKAVATFAIAVDRPYAKEKTADFFNVVVWGKNAENTANYQRKGSQVCVKGHLQSRSYEDKTGQKRYVTEVVADNVEFLGTKRTDTGSPESFGEEFDGDGFQSIEDPDDLPF